MKRYYITDRNGCLELLACVREAAAAGVDYIQIREKDLSARDLLTLTRRAVEIVFDWPTRILVNGRADVALAAGAHGIHLPANSIAATEWRRILPSSFLIGASCHSAEEIRASADADFLVYGPIFATPGKGESVGIDGLREAARLSSRPLFAVGGVTLSNAHECIQAGAAGIAGIRLFQR